MTPHEHDIRAYPFWKELTAIPSIEAIYAYGNKDALAIAVLCPEATSADWSHFMQVATHAEPHVAVTRLDALEPAALRKELLETKSLAYYKPSRAYKQFIPDIVSLIDATTDDLRVHLASPKPKNAEWLNNALQLFRRIVYSLLRLMRRVLLMLGSRFEAPVLILRQARANGWLEHYPLWENMHEDWQYSAHPCTPPVARDIIARMPEYMAAIHTTLGRINTLVAEPHA